MFKKIFLKKAFKTDYTIVSAFLHFLINYYNRRLGLIKDKIGLELDHTINSMDLLKFNQLNDLEINQNFNRIFNSKDGYEWWSILNELKNTNFGTGRVMNNDIENYENYLENLIKHRTNQLDLLNSMSKEDYFKRGYFDVFSMSYKEITYNN